MTTDHTTRSARRRRARVFWLTGSLAAGLLVSGTLPSSAGTPDVTVAAAIETTPSDKTGDTVDDMAIWVDAADPSRSVVIGADHGAHTLDVYDLSGARLQHLDLGDANNVDLRTGFPLGGATIDLVGVAGGGHSGGGVLRFFRLDPATRNLENVTVGGEFSVPSAHGFCMYHSAVSGKFYAFRVAPSGILQQFEVFDEAGKVNLKPAGEPFDVEPHPVDANSNDAIEGCTTDDEAGSLFIGEQDWGIWKYGAEPTAPRTKADRILVDGTDVNGGHITADVEGLAIVHEAGGGGFLLASSQGDDSFNVYRRQAPHEFVRKVRVSGGPRADGCERTDGIDAVAVNLGPAFPEGLFVCQDNHNTAPAPGNQNFKYVPLEQVVPLSAGPPATPPPPPRPGPTPEPTQTGTAPPAPSSDPTPRPSGYWMLGSAGRVYAFGDARPLGDPAGIRHPNRAVDLEPTPSGQGYWVVDATGAVFAYGDAARLGGVAAPLAPGEEVTSLSAAPSGHGYWIFTNLGRVVPIGDAPHLGDKRDSAEWARPRLHRHPERGRLLHGRLRPRDLLLRRRPLLRLHGRQGAQRPRPVAGARPGRGGLLAGGRRRRGVRLRRRLPGLHGRHPAQPTRHRHGRLRERLPDGRHRRRDLQLLRPPLPRLPRRRPAPGAHHVGGRSPMTAQWAVPAVHRHRSDQGGTAVAEKSVAGREYPLGDAVPPTVRRPL
jgi:3-phytase